jgi:hypothetical protein
MAVAAMEAEGISAAVDLRAIPGLHFTPGFPVLILRLLVTRAGFLGRLLMALPVRDTHDLPRATRTRDIVPTTVRVFALLIDGTEGASGTTGFATVFATGERSSTVFPIGWVSAQLVATRMPKSMAMITTISVATI